MTFLVYLYEKVRSSIGCKNSILYSHIQYYLFKKLYCKKISIRLFFLYIFLGTHFKVYMCAGEID